MAKTATTTTVRKYNWDEACKIAKALNMPTEAVWASFPVGARDEASKPVAKPEPKVVKAAEPDAPKLSPYDFTRKAVLKLRKPQGTMYKLRKKVMGADGKTHYVETGEEREVSAGIHAVYSGLNKAWKGYFGTDPVAGIKALVAEGKIVTVPVHGGVMVYLAEEAPERRQTEDERGGLALEAILAD